MQLRQWLAIHSIGEDRVGMKSFIERNITDKIRHFADRFVRSLEQDKFTGGFETCFFQQISETNTCPTGSAYCSFLPLNSGDRRIKESASVSRALERYSDGGLRHLL